MLKYFFINKHSIKLRSSKNWLGIIKAQPINLPIGLVRNWAFNAIVCDYWDIKFFQ